MILTIDPNFLGHPSRVPSQWVYQQISLWFEIPEAKSPPSTSSTSEIHLLLLPGQSAGLGGIPTPKDDPDGNLWRILNLDLIRMLQKAGETTKWVDIYVHVPSWELTYLLRVWYFWVDDFPNFPRWDMDSFPGRYIELYHCHFFVELYHQLLIGWFHCRYLRGESPKIILPVKGPLFKRTWSSSNDQVSGEITQFSWGV